MSHGWIGQARLTIDPSARVPDIEAPERMVVVCNSTNSDLISYFASLKEYWEHTPARSRPIFCAHQTITSRVHVDYVSSRAKSPSQYIALFADTVTALWLLPVLRIARRRRILLFTSAHISNIGQALLWKAMGGRCVFIIHDWQPHPGRNFKLVSWYNKLVVKWLGDAFIAFSRTALAHLPPRTEIVQLGGIEKVWGAADRPALEQRPGAPDYFLVFGRVEPYKGYEILPLILDAYSAIGGRKGILVAGSGDKKLLDNISGDSRVTIRAEYIPDVQLPEVFRRAIAVLLPYSSATQSGVALLAFSLGVPVVAFRTGALSEYVVNGASGELAEPGDHHAFAAAMLKIERDRQPYVINSYLQYSTRHVARVFAGNMAAAMRRIMTRYLT